MSKAQILLNNQQKGVNKVSRPINHYYAVGEKTVSQKNEKGESSPKQKSFLLSHITSFRNQAIEVFDQWAKENGLRITYIGVYR